MSDQPTEPAEKPTRRKVDEVFGDILPDTTADERDSDSARSDGDSWYLENRPPHHGG
jgi:hypothetical protein